jgi:hypothetical protein
LVSKNTHTQISDDRRNGKHSPIRWQSSDAPYLIRRTVSCQYVCARACAFASTPFRKKFELNYAISSNFTFMNCRCSKPRLSNRAYTTKTTYNNDTKQNVTVTLLLTLIKVYGGVDVYWHAITSALH